MIDFRYIKPKDIIILDDGYSNLKFKDYSYELINIKKINIFCVLISLYKYIFYKNSLNFKQTYKQTLYRMYSPKIAISHHISKRSVECKFLCPEIKNAIYQFTYINHKRNFNKKKLLGSFKKKNLIDYLFVFHKKDKENIDFDKSRTFVVGSVKNNEKILSAQKKIKNSLLFISEYNPKFPQSKDYYKKEFKLLKLIYDFCKINNKKLYIALRSNRKDKKKKIKREEEIKFYNKIFGDKFFTSDMDSYKLAARSEIIICISSNLGIELLARKKKVLFILMRESKNNRYAYLPKDELFVQRNLDKNLIFTKLEKMYKISKKNWEKILNTKIDNLIFDQHNKILKKKIKTIIQSYE